LKFIEIFKDVATNQEYGKRALLNIYMELTGKSNAQTYRDWDKQKHLFTEYKKGARVYLTIDNTIRVNQDTCNGVTLEKEKCKHKINKTLKWYEDCHREIKDMCYMHCDCLACHDKYAAQTEGQRYNVQTEEQNYQSLTGIDLSKTLKAIENESNPDKLKLVCSILARTHPLIFTECVDAAKKVNSNKKILNKINILQAELDKLKEELK
jgi:queuine/archaeosine tRNA-ribosyltransferase